MGAEVGEGVGEVLEAGGLEVDDLALAFDAAFGEQGDGGVGGAAVFFEDLGADDEVGGAGLVLQGAKDDAQGGRGSLADEDQAGDADPLALFGLAEVARSGDS